MVYSDYNLDVNRLIMLLAQLPEITMFKNNE